MSNITRLPSKYQLKKVPYDNEDEDPDIYICRKAFDDFLYFGEEIKKAQSDDKLVFCIIKSNSGKKYVLRVCAHNDPMHDPEEWQFYVCTLRAGFEESYEYAKKRLALIGIDWPIFWVPELNDWTYLEFVTDEARETHERFERWFNSL